jgi:glycerophosphoryl diester phosphodiesterase
VSDLFKVALSQLRAVWRQVLTVHLVYTGLGVIVFAPLVGLLGQAILKLSGKPVLADMDLLFFALSPTGAVAFGLFAAVTIVISAFELTSLLAIAVARADGKSVSVFVAVAFILGRVTRIFLLAGRLVIKVLITVAPFLILAGIAAYFLITDYDINYYLAVQPPEFWMAAVIIGFLGVVMSVLLIRRLVGWSLALPLVLFARVSPAQSFSRSAELTRRSSYSVLRVLAAWFVVTLSIGAVITLSIRLAADVLMPLFIESVNSLVILFGLLAVIWMALSVAATALTTGFLAFLLVGLTVQLEPDFRRTAVEVGVRHKLEPDTNTRRWSFLGLAFAVGVAVFIGTALLQAAKVNDNVQIIAHRGASLAAPENTMAAIDRAIADGADWIEIDVQESADGEVVVIHDRDLMKLAGVSLRVSEATVEQLAGIDIGSWFAPEFSEERVPLLADVLAKVKGRSKLIVELKYYGRDEQLEQRVVELIEAAGMQDDTMIMSLEFSGVQKVRALRPDWKVGLLSARAVGDLTRLDVDFLAVQFALARGALVRATHAADKELYVWTVNDPLSISQMMSLGVDGVITDEPLIGREVLKGRAELSSVQRLLLHIAKLLGVDPPSLNIESNDAEFDDSNINLELVLQQRLQDRIVSPDSELAEFTTDGCSGGLSAGWDTFAEQAGFFRDRHGKRPPWEHCCVVHDRAYHVGGGPGLTPSEAYAARLQADDFMHACVLETAIERRDELRTEYGISDDQVAELYLAIADSMHLAIRLGGMPCTGLSWRWGYGWPHCE